MSFNTQGAKRSAEDFARTHHNVDFDDTRYGGSQPSKKPRFDVRNPSALAPDAREEDAVLDADVIGSKGQQVRRGAVNIDGYDSDSENENFDVRSEAKARMKKAAEQKSKEEEEEDDMFADLEDDFRDGNDSEGDTARRGGKSKVVRFMDEDEIEGQVKNSKSGGHVSADFSLNPKGKSIDKDQESSSDSEVDDATRASHGEVDAELGAGSKKAHAPKLDAFNMRSENEEGRFDEQGNYVRKAADPDAKHDVWLQGVSKKDMKKAKEAHDQREEERRKRALEDDAKSTGDVLALLLPHLDRGETVLEALARLNKKKDSKHKGSNRWKSRKVQKEAQDTEMIDTVVSVDDRKQAINAITEAADLLLARGQPEIYETEKELLTRQYRRETGSDWSEVEADNKSAERYPAANNKSWEYQWIDARDGGEVHGPYDGDTMKQWNDAGYFGEGVQFREHGSNSWRQEVDFV